MLKKSDKVRHTVQIAVVYLLRLPHCHYNKIIITPHTCARGKVIGYVVVAVVNKKIVTYPYF